MVIQGQAGPIVTTTSIPQGQLQNLRLGNMGDLVVQEMHGRYYEQAYRRTSFVAANPTGVTSSAFTSGTTTAIVGLTLSNPPGSNINAVLGKIGFSFTLAFAAAAEIGLAVGYNNITAVTHTTPLITRSTFIGLGPNPICSVDSSSTVPTAPNTIITLGAGLTGAITTIPYIAPTIIDLEGSIILPPGAYASIITTAASGASGFFASITWEETPNP